MYSSNASLLYRLFSRFCTSSIGLLVCYWFAIGLSAETKNQRWGSRKLPIYWFTPFFSIREPIELNQ